MNPGDTRDPHLGCPPSVALNEGRGMNPGDTWRGGPAGLRRSPLNEGRGMNPGDTANAPGRLAESDRNQNLPFYGDLLDIVPAAAQAKRASRATTVDRFPPAEVAETQDHRTFARSQNTQGSPSSRPLPRPKRVRESASGPGKR